LSHEICNILPKYANLCLILLLALHSESFAFFSAFQNPLSLLAQKLNGGHYSRTDDGEMEYNSPAQYTYEARTVNSAGQNVNQNHLSSGATPNEVSVEQLKHILEMEEKNKVID
jgi:hypothetical protein